MSNPNGWKGSVFRRRRKLWLKVKGPHGWTQLRTPFHVGEEKWLATRKGLVEDAAGDERVLRLHVFPHSRPRRAESRSKPGPFFTIP
jgi:hypothetical protein